MSKILGLSKYISSSEFTVHTNDPLFDRWRLGNEVETVFSYLTKSPNHFRSIFVNKMMYGLLGVAENHLPATVAKMNVSSIARCRQADLVVASGGDIFTSDYGNLRKHLAYAYVSPKNRFFLCGHSIGPFNSRDEESFKKAAGRFAAITVRERESYEYLRSIDIQAELHLTADVAFTLPSLPQEEARAYVQDRFGVHEHEQCVAVSVSQGIIRYSGLDPETYYQTFVDFCDELISVGKFILLIPHVMEVNPNNNDFIACERVFKKLKKPFRARIISGEPDCIVLKSVIGACECLIGTRTHATIASMSQMIPTVSIAYSRKAYGIMDDVYGETLGRRLTIPAKNMSLETLLAAWELARKTRIESKRISEIKNRAEDNFRVATRLIG